MFRWNENGIIIKINTNHMKQAKYDMKVNKLSKYEVEY